MSKNNTVSNIFNKLCSYLTMIVIDDNNFEH